MSDGIVDILTTASLTHVGRVREANQDSCAEFLSERGMRLLVVADGMGGHAGGEVASKTAVDSMGETLQNGVGDPEDLLREAFEAANAAIFKMASEVPDLYGMGTTGVAVLVASDGAAWVAHVGDSRAYLLHDGEFAPITDDHSWVAEEVRQGRLTEEEAEVHPKRNALLRSLGVDPDVQVDVNQIEIAAGDRVLLCSDGLWGELDDQSIAGVLASEEPKDCVYTLVGLANESGGRDNVTVQVLAMPGAVNTMRLPPLTAEALERMRRRRPRSRWLALVLAAGAAAATAGWLWLGSGT